ncbi:MAG: hypothetical protein Q8O68_00645 [Candidatus Daviesbacteria bacterium]|nr:hypothetical protein [Candidatus Daviesbacteria bacterium]
MVKKEVTIIPYTYWGMESGFKEIDVAVIKGEEHPDPAKQLLWGRDCNGNVISDFKKRGWTKSGNPIKIEYKINPNNICRLTAHCEKEEMIKVVDEYWKKNKCKI